MRLRMQTIVTQDGLPRSRRKYQRKGEALQANVASREDELAIHALSELPINASVLARLAGGVRSQPLELAVQSLSLLAVRERERRATDRTRSSEGH